MKVTHKKSGFANYLCVRPYFSSTTSLSLQLISNHPRLHLVLLVLMLQELTHLTKRLGALLTVIRLVRHSTMIVARSIGQARCICHVPTQRLLGLCKVVNRLASAIFSLATRAVPAFHVLHRVGAALETLLTTDRTRHGARTMHLHVHLQIVLILEGPGAFMTLKGGNAHAVDAIAAARVSISLRPLISTELRTRTVAVAFGARTSHCAW